MKQGAVYTIVFIFLLTALFTAVLAVADAYYAPRIAENVVLAERRDVLYALGIDDTGDAAALNARFDAQVTKRTVGGIEVYEQNLVDGPHGIAVPFTGSGLWGTIRGFLAVSSDFTRITGIVFTEQQETPGLGGRIDELQYKEQFRGVPITGAKIVYGMNGDKEIDAVTGATITSNSVLRIVNGVVDDTLPKLEVTP
jgi:Na+-transporting NADH:ubiquinone oxidoreductase subunit C